MKNSKFASKSPAEIDSFLRKSQKIVLPKGILKFFSEVPKLTELLNS